MGQWYRKGAVKAVVLTAGILGGAVCAASFAVVTDVSGTASPSAVAEMLGKPYEESEEFRASVKSMENQVFEKIRLTDFFETDGAYDPDKLIDIVQYGKGGNVNGENTSGVAYRLEDLVHWSEAYMDSGTGGYYDGDTYISYNTSEDGFHEENGVAVCRREDGSYEYFYMDDLLRLFEEGALSAEFADEYTSQAEFLRALKEGTYFSSPSGMTISDASGKVVYVDCWNFGESLRERYVPDGATNLLEAVNQSPQLNGKLEEIYQTLEWILGSLQSEYESYRGGWEYLEEENTNFSYLYVYGRTKTVETNRSEYEKFADAEANLEEMTSGDSVKYMIIYPDLQDFRTNMDVSAYEEWMDGRAYAEQANASEGSVFAMAVDTSYPVQDRFYEESAAYRERVPELSVSLAIFCAGGLLFLAAALWLTVTAGKKPESRETALNRFDRWKTEPAAAAVILVWAAVTWIFGVSNMFGFSWGGMSGVIFVFLYGLFTCACFFWGYLSLVRRIRAHTLWSGSLLRAGMRFGKRVFAARSAVTRALLILLAFLAVHWLAILSRSIPVLLLAFAAGCAAVWYVLKSALARTRIRDGIGKIAAGDLAYRIDLTGLGGADLAMAEQVNEIGNGLNRAVDDAMKNERMKTDLITNVSHDIKTPLTSIINYVDILKRSDLKDEKIRGYLDILEAKAQRLKTLTEDVVEASKASSGNITMEYTDLDLGELIRQAEGETAEKFAARNLTLILTMPEEPAVIHADGRRLWRVLENLFGNAAKYAMPGTRVYADLTAAEGQVRFTLKNISEQQLNISADELTERFIRGDLSRSTEGSGLGLSIAKSLTTLQGGEFELYLDGDLFKAEIRFRRVQVRTGSDPDRF